VRVCGSLDTCAVFDDGDVKKLSRNLIKIKGKRHFDGMETLDRVRRVCVMMMMMCVWCVCV
jgi:hypothetical protein